MRHFVTGLALLAVGLLWTPRADAQVTDVTIRQINEINPDSLAALIADAGTMNMETIFRRMYQGRDVAVGDTVRFGAVTLSNPLNSGLASVNNGIVGRIHIFVRDTSAVTMGNEGMTIQVVDGNFSTINTIGLEIGDVFEMIAVVAPFPGDAVMQLTPISMNVLGKYDELGLPDSILDPVDLSTADLNMALGGDEIQVNWQNIADLQGQYVRIEGATIMQREQSTPARPNWSLSDDGGATAAGIRDVSLRFRGDRSNYPDNFNKRTGNYVPPPPGSVVDIQGFTALSTFDIFGRTNTLSLNLAPFEDGDVVIVESPPLVATPSQPPVPGADPTPVTAVITADPTRTITAVSLSFYTSADPDTVTIDAGAPTGDSYPFEIPAAPDGAFVTYWVSATDNTGAVSVSSNRSYRVLADGIDSIEDIQFTASGGVGQSPFVGVVVPTNFEAVVQTDGAVTGYWSLQDDADAPWSGIEVASFDASSPVPEVGDIVTVTQALVIENFNLTRLGGVIVTINGSGDPYPHKLMTTDVLRDLDIAEAHEGMLVRFENVTIIAANEGNGEWSFSSDGTADNKLKADDFSSQISSTFNTETFEDGDTVTYIQGLLSYTFNEYKVFPATAADIGDVNLAVDEDNPTGGYGLSQNYPNPFSGSTSITITTPESGQVRLEVFDVLGRHVSTLIDGVIPSGEHTVSFDRRGLASGLYMYRLSAESNTIVRTMTVVR